MELQRVNAATLSTIFTLMFLIGTENFLISPILPTIASDLNVPIAAAAQTVSLYMIFYAMFAPFLGTFSDLIGRQRLISVGSVLFILGNIAASYASTLAGLLLARLLTAIGAAMAGPSMWAFIGDTTHPSIRGKVMGWVMASFALGQFLGVPIGSYISGSIGWKWAFRVIGIMTLVLAPVLIRQVYLYPVRKTKQTGNPIISSFYVFQNKEIWLALLTCFFWAGANFGSFTYLGALLKARYDLSTTNLGLVTGLVGVGSLAGGLIAGRIVDFWRSKDLKEGLLQIVWITLLCTSIIGLTHTHFISLTLFCLLVWFFSSGAFIATQQTLLTLIAADLKARSISWSNSFMYVGTAAGVTVAGHITQQDQWENIWYSTLAFCLLAGMCALSLSSTAIHERVESLE
ncbi:MFS transporter [Desulfovibrio inopinatus]|uniref:MFS transporter n=1 Tax=Desulfovibrio inopinatus TaxID=102109 RepID=UPI0003F53067|nr:MFS transporter [Desulfovibrio inopinatus]